MKTAQQVVDEIQKLELEIGKLIEEQAEKTYLTCNNYPKILKLTRKVQKLRDKL